MRFGASIDLTLGQFRYWTGTPAAAVSAVDVAVRALPSVGWIDVKYCGNAPVIEPFGCIRRVAPRVPTGICWAMK